MPARLKSTRAMLSLAERYLRVLSTDRLLMSHLHISLPVCLSLTLAGGAAWACTPAIDRVMTVDQRLEDEVPPSKP